MKNIVILILILLFTSCGIIMINENEYRSLKDSDKNQIRSFDINLVPKKVDNTEQLYLYEINTNDIQNCVKMQKYTWIHLWRPFCQSEYCQNINYFLTIENNLKQYELEFMLISESYDFNSIENAVKNSFYDKPIFVLQDLYYGHKIRPNRLKFYNELKTEYSPKTRIGFDDYLFKDTILIFAGEDLNKHKIDSLMIKNNR
jgi:hypothetical protein